VLAEVLFRSLDYARSNLARWNSAEAEFVRHIFQRLTKPELFAIPELGDMRAIASKLFLNFGDDLFTMLKQLNDGAVYARWAGTLSSLMAPRGDLDRVGEIICELCVRASPTLHSTATDTRVIVPLLRAINRLQKRAPSNPQIQTLIESVKQILNFDEMLLSIVRSGDAEWPRRANAFLYVYVEFLAQTHVGPKDQLSRRILSVYRRAETRLAEHDFEFDAGNAAYRARSVMSREIVHAKHIRKAASYLAQAAQSVRNEPRISGSWKGKVDRMIFRFERNHGPLANHARVHAEAGVGS
jgi:hypothetical protein